MTNHKKGYTIVDNTSIRDKTLSLRAKGLFVTMLSLPETWVFSVRGLASVCGATVYAVRSGMSELTAGGYVKRERRQDKATGHHKWVYELFPEPKKPAERSFEENAENPFSENPTAENPTAENPTAENQTLLNKDIIIKDLSIKDLSNKDNKARERALSEIGNKKLLSAVERFISMREKQQRGTLCAESVEMLVKRLNEMSPDDEERIEIVEQSVRNGWRDLYVPKRRESAPEECRELNGAMPRTQDPELIESIFMSRLAG